ncbi:hypothetical protein QUB75_30910 [Microcoleus sp. K1-B6]|uniref:hypothetical protein n=1 Tax=unclassified Microcoleus TaxID=2642155 RepID=UPI002FD66577
MGCLPDKQPNTKQSEIPLQAIELQQSASIKYVAKDVQGCLEDSERALSIDNNFALAHFYKGLCQYSSGQVQEGLSSMENAARIAKSKGRNDVAEKISDVLEKAKIISQRNSGNPTNTDYSPGDISDTIKRAKKAAEEAQKNSGNPTNTDSSPGDISDTIKRAKKAAEEAQKNSGNPTNTDSSSGGELDNSTPLSNPGVSDQDRKFLVSVQNQLDENGFVWDTWNTLDGKEKVKIGRSACETMGIGDKLRLNCICQSVILLKKTAFLGVENSRFERE